VDCSFGTANKFLDLGYDMQLLILKLCNKVKLYIVKASGSVSGPKPTKSRGLGLVKP